MEDEKRINISNWIGLVLLAVTLLSTELYAAGRLWNIGYLNNYGIDESVFYEDFHYYLILGFKKSL